MLCQLSYTPAARPADLLRLTVKCMPPAAWAVLLKLDPVRIVLLVLARGVRPLLALGAGELDRRARFDSWPCSPYSTIAGDGAGADGVATLADGEALAGLEGDGGDQLDASSRRCRRA